MMKCAALILLCCVMFLSIDPTSALYKSRFISPKQMDGHKFDDQLLRRIARENLNLLHKEF
uniref:Uncharacterized protein n=1 Tax=Ciona intestinalis TaxID=7719 RepID=F6ZPJ7_CIOIN